MTEDAFNLLSSFLGFVWKFFNSLMFPGTNITMAEIGFFALFVPLFVKLIQRTLTGVSSIHVKGGKTKGDSE